jgi:beta-lactamase class A
VIDGCFIADAVAREGLGAASVIIEPLPGTRGPAVRLDPDRPLYPASMIKVPIAAALAVLYAGGTRRPDDPLEIAAEHMTANDAPSPFVAGFRTTLAAAAHAMVAASDNVATNALIDALGRDHLTRIARDDLGLEGTAVRRKLSGSLPLIDDPAANGRNAHPAGDAAALFALIDRERTGRFAAVYAALEAQVWNDKLGAALRPGDRFAHKTGDTDEASHDGGILALADGRRFVVVVYTALEAGPAADARIAAFGRSLRHALDPEWATDPANS